jgi:hypothetical protein
MSILERLFGTNRKRSPRDGEDQQAVLVHLDGTGLPDETYERFDLATLEDRLLEVMSRRRLGEIDGHEIGPSETIVFLYGPDAERLYAGIEPVLRTYPLCANARVVIRSGGAGAPEREVRVVLG